MLFDGQGVNLNEISVNTIGHSLHNTNMTFLSYLNLLFPRQSDLLEFLSGQRL